MLGGVLHRSGYFLGDDLYPPRDSNPVGFFENSFINGINERILEPFDGKEFPDHLLPVGFSHSPHNPYYGQRWLSFIGPGVTVSCNDIAVAEEIRIALNQPVFAYKDPRFNYTLPVWEQYLSDNVVLVCIFRHPATVVDSVLLECKSAGYLTGFYITREMIFDLWCNSYGHLFRFLNQNTKRKCLFIHYEHMLNRSANQKLCQFLDAEIDFSLVDPELNRSTPGGGITPAATNVYKKLCHFSGFPI